VNVLVTLAVVKPIDLLLELGSQLLKDSLIVWRDLLKQIVKVILEPLLYL